MMVPALFISLFSLWYIWVSPSTAFDIKDDLFSFCNCPWGYFNRSTFPVFVLSPPPCTSYVETNSCAGLKVIKASQCSKCHPSCSGCFGPTDAHCLNCAPSFYLLPDSKSKNSKIMKLMSVSTATMKLNRLRKSKVESHVEESAPNWGKTVLPNLAVTDQLLLPKTPERITQDYHNLQQNDAKSEEIEKEQLYADELASGFVDAPSTDFAENQSYDPIQYTLPFMRTPKEPVITELQPNTVNIYSSKGTFSSSQSLQNEKYHKSTLTQQSEKNRETSVEGKEQTELHQHSLKASTLDHGECQLPVLTESVIPAIADKASFRCVSKCPKGTYNDKQENKCVHCDSKCETCVGPSFMNCTLCVSGAVQASVHPKTRSSANSTITCLSECATNHFNKNGICMPCHEACLGCTGANQNQCLRCRDDTVTHKDLSTNQKVVLCKIEHNSERAVANLEVILPLSFILLIIIITVFICIKWHMHINMLKNPFMNACKNCTINHQNNDHLTNFSTCKNQKKKVRNDYTPGPPTNMSPSITNKESEDGYELPLPPTSNQDSHGFCRTRSRRNDDPLPPPPKLETTTGEKLTHMAKSNPSQNSTGTAVNQPSGWAESPYANSEGLYANC